MKVGDLMKIEVKTIEPDASISDAMLMLADSHISALPVVDRSGKMVGVLSRTDILAAEEDAESAPKRDALLAGTYVRDLMTSLPHTISPDADVRSAAQQMLDADVHRLYVSADDRVIGAISMSDIVRAVASGAL
jgi:CBS domain-containing protein